MPVVLVSDIYFCVSCLVNCQKACKKCDDQRPCERCSKYGLEASCRDSARKERKKGVRRGPYSRIVDDGDTDDSETTCWSDETRARTTGQSPVSDGFACTSPGSSGRSWQETTSSRAFRTAGSNFKVPDSQHGVNRSAIQIGAPDSSYIKALSMVCSEVLKKIEEDSMPPAVTVKPFVQKDDVCFQQVSFAPSLGPSSVPFNTGHEVSEPAPLRQPIPLQCIGTNGLLSDEPNSSSPVHEDSPLNFTNQSFEIMTPPETPVTCVEGSRRAQDAHLVTLPSISDMLQPEYF